MAADHPTTVTVHAERGTVQVEIPIDLFRLLLGTWSPAVHVSVVRVGSTYTVLLRQPALDDDAWRSMWSSVRPLDGDVERDEKFEAG